MRSDTSLPEGTLASAPAGHTHATLLVGGRGVRAATMRWGDLLRRAAGGGKRRSMAWTLAGDPSLRSLSYYTDNGAYYCAPAAVEHGRLLRVQLATHRHAPPTTPFLFLCSDYQTAPGTGTCSTQCPGKVMDPTPQDATGYQQTMRQLLDYFGNISLPVAAVLMLIAVIHRFFGQKGES